MLCQNMLRSTDSARPRWRRQGNDYASVEETWFSGVKLHPGRGHEALKTRWQSTAPGRRL